MKIPFEWEEIYRTPDNHDFSFFEQTYRAKVIGGWLIRHETCTDYQYSTVRDDDASVIRHVINEGYQDLKNSIIFILDAEHKWEIN